MSTPPASPPRSFWRTALATVLLFLLGVFIGHHHLMGLFGHWIGIGANNSVVFVTIDESMRFSAQVSLGCGVLFASAPVAAVWIARSPRPVRATLAYLLIGAAAFYLIGTTFQATSWQFAPQPGFLAPIPSIDKLRIWRIPLFATLAVLLIGLVHRAVLLRRP
jgi:hypothetical protein